jgi:hypothetical protein
MPLAELSTRAFYQELLDNLNAHFPPYPSRVIELNNLRLKARIHHAPLFLAVFYAANTGKISVAILHNNQRVLGFDNLNGWHVHPFENPDHHVPIPEPSLEYIVRECGAIVNLLAS